MTDPPELPFRPTTLMPIGRPIRHLRPEIEAVMKARFASLPSDAAAVWGTSGWRSAALGLAGRPVLTVAPGPLVSPYDSPRFGFASLRFTLDGRPVGGSATEPAFGRALRERRLGGRNRYAISAAAASEEMFAARPTPALAFVGPHAAASPRWLSAFLERVSAVIPAGGIVAAGPDGCPRPSGTLPDRVTLIGEPADPWSLAPRASRVVVESWEDGYEALVCGADIVCLDAAEGVDAPDEAALLARRYGAGVHYFDPWTRRPIGMAEALDQVTWLRGRFVANDRRAVLVGISRWKRPAIDVFSDGPQGTPIHTMTAEDAVGLARRHGARVQAWATRMPERLPRLCAEAGLPLSRIEDGFLRSVGLGASLKLGASIVVDDHGIYYDPRTESGLTRILKETAFTPELRDRARRLRESIVARRLSKYNVGLPETQADWPTDRRIVLVPGQVEDDASVQYGSPNVRSNLDLLRAARARNPDAFLLYKPHPDVEAGFRPGKIPEEVALGLGDRIVGGLSIVDLLDRVHHVETMTSLTGFEALLRGLGVATHGKPFYAGWGLTEDLAPNADRGRTLVLDELVAGALILYARYIDPVAMKPCEPEQLLDRLSAAREAEAPSRLSLNAIQHVTMRARYALLNPLVRRLRSRRGVGGGSNQPPR